MRLPAAQLGIATFFLYAGLEAGTGGWAYSFLMGARAASMAAGASVSAYWASLMVGRVLFAVTPLARRSDRTVGVCIAVAASSAAALAADLGPQLSSVAIATLGLAAAPSSRL
jgi:fucose permease